MNFAYRTTHEIAILRSSEHHFSAQVAIPDDDAVIKCNRSIELWQMRTPMQVMRVAILENVQ
jgi:hypothetical protein